MQTGVLDSILLRMRQIFCRIGMGKMFSSSIVLLSLFQKHPSKEIGKVLYWAGCLKSKKRLFFPGENYRMGGKTVCLAELSKGKRICLARGSYLKVLCLCE